MIHASVPDGRRVVAVIGGGFSGLLTAIHLLAADPRLTVRLIERASRFARGRAYDTDSPDHLLNVRASNMSAFPDQPGHFLAWLSQHEAAEDVFVSRRRYGDYLQALLREAIGDPSRPGRLLLEQDEASAVVRSGARWRVELALGRSFLADAVVLAIGLLPPSPLPGVTATAAAHPNYVAEPWAADLHDMPDGEILLLGTGLTMVDVALSLAGPTRALTALSRRGLPPRVHAAVSPAEPPAGLPAPPQTALRLVRRRAQEVGWRAAVDSLRPHTAALWGSWSETERRRFLRHLRPWWDAHRHRMAPPVGARIAELAASGRLTIQGGALRSLDVDGDGFTAAIRPRGGREVASRRFAAVVNCTGLSADPAADRSGLLASLCGRGLARRDALALGLDVDSSLRLIGEDGRPTPGLYVAGPLSRSAFWETVAVPDLRLQTAQLAQVVVGDLVASS